MLKGELTYSSACKRVNTTANTSVNSNAKIVCFLDRARIAWCDQLIVAPEVNKIKVFANGIV